MIPQFDHNSVLPPHLGNPAVPSDLSPYQCTSMELVTTFSTNQVRIELLKNLLNFRIDLRAAGLGVNCFQWIDGSFVEDKERLLGAPPGDIDVLTFYFGYDNAAVQQIVAAFPAFSDRTMAKNRYTLDHIPLNLAHGPLFAYNAVKYYSMLFNHSRSGVWKGILLLELNTPTEDNQALHYLNQI